jgi:polyhydroxybutyrate depolymerase
MLAIIALACVIHSVQPENSKQPENTAAIEATGELTPREWMIGETKREALIWIPAQSQDGLWPVVFAFHGHGGNARSGARNFRIHELWPQAICVYMEGLPTKTTRDPEGKRNGWQRFGGENDDRDLKFFDAVLESLLKEDRGDADRVFITGHSNGASFTQTIWAERGNFLAAVAPSAGGSVRQTRNITALPSMHIAGTNDLIVDYSQQKELMTRVREVNGCEGEGILREDGCREYASKSGNPCVEYVHEGGHQYPAEAPGLIVKFFKQHARKRTDGSPVKP